MASLGNNTLQYPLCPAPRASKSVEGCEFSDPAGGMERKGGSGQGTAFKRRTRLLWIHHKLVRTD